MKKINFSSHFFKRLKKCSPKVQKRFWETLHVFEANFFDNRLQTHKLKGSLKNYWSFSVDYSHRAIFSFLKDGSVLFHDIGSHKIYE